jgi:hypothetical protein
MRAVGEIFGTLPALKSPGTSSNHCSDPGQQCRQNQKKARYPMTDAHDKLQVRLAEYKAAQAAVADLEQKLAKAKDDEAAALTDDAGDEHQIVAKLRDSQALQAVYSRRLYLARKRAGRALAPVRAAVVELYRELDDKVTELVESRSAAHRAVFSARVDGQTLHADLITHGYVLQFPIIITVADHCYDVLAAKNCKPYIRWANSRSEVTLEQLEADFAALVQARAEYETEAGRNYDFTPASETPQTLEIRETNLVEQPA